MNVAEKEGCSDVRPSEHPSLLRVEKLSKHFPGVIALDKVDFELKAGEVHVLFGENGAGKSTLIQTLAGVHRPSGGNILFRGEPLSLQSVHHARSLGISAVFQEFSLVATLTVEQNLFLGSELMRGGFLDKRATRRRAKEILDELGFSLNPRRLVQDLSRAEQQMLEIAKAFRTDLSVLILDEPTASLTDREADRLFVMINRAKQRGVGIIYITHRMNEIHRVGDRITVLRDGRLVKTLPMTEATGDRLLQLMTGRVIDQVFPHIEYRPGNELLEIKQITTKSHSVVDLSFHVRAGEIVGLAGLVGSGKSEAGRACYGLERLASGRILFQGQELSHVTPRSMLDRGLFYLPPDRREEGLVMQRSVSENIALCSLTDQPFSRFGVFLSKRGERAKVLALASQLNLHPLRIERDVQNFSGGNQQKVLFAKGLTRSIKLFILDEPTVGVDVGTRVAIYELIRDLCHEGAGILLISSDLPEILHLTNRTYVMHRGRLSGELIGSEITQESVLGHFFEHRSA